ncbi:MAG: DEAD/DEAH box helicase, partial [Flavobacteriales bacterium]
ASALIALSLGSKIGGDHIFILSDKEEAAYFLNDLQNIISKTDVDLKPLFFPESHRQPYELEETDNSEVQQRAEVLNNIENVNKGVLLVTYPEALSEKVLTKKEFSKNIIKIKSGQELSPDFINEMLIELNFEKVDQVHEPGQFAQRGGIIDIFSFAQDHPHRIDFFGNNVDTIRTFDPISQLSIQRISHLTVIPNIRKEMITEERSNLLEFVNSLSSVWIKNPELLQGKLNDAYQKAEKAYEQLTSPLDHLKPEELYTSYHELYKNLESYPNIIFGTKAQDEKSSVSFDFSLSPQPSFNKNFDFLLEDLKSHSDNGKECVIVASSKNQVERLYSIIEDKGFKDLIDIKIFKLPLSEGFIDNSNNFLCYTDHQIFQRYHKFKLKEGYNKTQKALTLKELNELSPGDYVTHIDHGIGQYSGLEKIDVNGKEQEAIRLTFKDNDILYVSIHSLHRIAKYTSQDGKVPSLNKLGSGDWQKKKQKTKKRVKELAFDLISLYAKRKAKKGYAFSRDTYLQNELEASFLFEDTPDQIKVTNEVKKDMEKNYPMDRLICGDVGFGKTEVAIRAAFKAVADSKQVALMAPTTILTFQHYQSFKERLKDFPCNIGLLNRFRSAKEQRETINKVKKGEIDIIIGTHRLVNKNIELRDLGLLIIDEEQKFGVSVKDKLKTVKPDVDTLTLTATPIPRTLQFSLMGARDLSVINTPPPNRYPVQTQISTFNEEMLRDAIQYEVSREGQVYFVHNRIDNIKEVSGLIQRLCPDVKVATAHGRMKGDKLENLMLDFME